MRYSDATGKVCPGDAKILQIPGILVGITGGSSAPVVAPQGGPLEVDGFWGSSTTRRAQTLLGLPVDGEVRFQFPANKQDAMTSGWVFDFVPGKGSPLITRMQEVMAAAGQYGGTVDGVAGPEFARGLQRRFGLAVDGTLPKRSPAVKALQGALNAGVF
jgi:hypothetical protein